MPFSFPTQATLCQAFSSHHPLTRATSQKNETAPTKRTFFPAWSVTEDAKSKVGQLGEEAAKEYEKVSAKAQEKAGKIELYSAKYYAACTFGGLLACVGLP